MCQLHGCVMGPGSVVRLYYKICIIKTVTVKAIMIEYLYKKKKKISVLCCIMPLGCDIMGGITKAPLLRQS